TFSIQSYSADISTTSWRSSPRWTMRHSSPSKSLACCLAGRSRRASGRWPDHSVDGCACVSAPKILGGGWHRAHAGPIGAGSAARGHDRNANEYHRDRDHLRHAQAERPGEAVVLGAEELDDET